MTDPFAAEARSQDAVSLDGLVSFLGDLADVQDSRKSLQQHASTQAMSCLSRVTAARSQLQVPIQEAIEGAIHRGMEAVGELGAPIDLGIAHALAGIQELRAVLCKQCGLNYEGETNEQQNASVEIPREEAPLVDSPDDERSKGDDTETGRTLPRAAESKADEPRRTDFGCSPVDVSVRFPDVVTIQFPELAQVDLKPEPEAAEQGKQQFRAENVLNVIRRWLADNATLTVDSEEFFQRLGEAAESRTGRADLCPFSFAIGVSNADCRLVTPSWLEPLNIRYDNRIMGQGVFSMGSVLANGLHNLLGQFDILGGILLSPCTGDRFRATIAVATRGLIGLLETWGTGRMPFLTNALEHFVNYQCPTELPSVSDAIAANTAGQISRQMAIAIARANGLAPRYFSPLLEAAESRFSPHECGMLRHRGMMTPEQFEEELDMQGWKRDSDTYRIWQLAQFIPPISDLITFMVRDVADMELVRRFGMDDQFSQKWQGDVKRQGNWQGISDDVARQYWRAHWHLPSPTQLFEFWRRNRHLPDGSLARVTEDDIRAALVQQDILPFWIDKFLHTSFHPLTRTDTQRAFNIGAMTRRQVRQSYLDNGYSDENAETLTAFTERLRVERYRNHWLVRLYKQGGLTGLQLRQRLADQGVDNEDGLNILSLAEIELDGKRRMACLKGLRKRFMQGEWSFADTIGRVQQLNFSTAESTRYVERWQCEMDARDKSVPAAKLCQWHGAGLLGSDEYVARLVRLGYSAKDVERLMKQCRLELSDRQQRALVKAAREAAREAANEDRIQEARTLRERRESERVQAGRERSMRMRQDRERRLSKSALTVAKKSGSDFVDVLRLFRTAFTASRQNYGLTPDEVLQTIEDVSKTYKDWRPAIIVEVILQAARERRQADLHVNGQAPIGAQP